MEILQQGVMWREYGELKGNCAVSILQEVWGMCEYGGAEGSGGASLLTEGWSWRGYGRGGKATARLKLCGLQMLRLWWGRKLRLRNNHAGGVHLVWLEWG